MTNHRSLHVRRVRMSRSVPGESSECGGRFGSLTAGLEAAAESEVVQDVAVEASDSSCNSDKSCEKENHVEEFKTHCLY